MEARHTNKSSSKKINSQTGTLNNLIKISKKTFHCINILLDAKSSSTNEYKHHQGGAPSNNQTNRGELISKQNKP